jgi:site-specific recombinase XerD
MTVSEAFEAFELDELVSENRSQSTVDSYRGTCGSLLRAVGQDMDIALLTYMHIIRWKKYMHDCGNSGAHMAFQLRELRRVLTYLKSHGFGTLDASEIKIPTFKYKTTEWLTLEEVQRFLGAITNIRDKALFACMFSSGARISELLSLNRDSIVNGAAHVTGKGRDGGQEGVLEFDPNALAVLDSYLETRDDTFEPLFLSHQRHTGGRLRVQRCIQLAHHYAELAGIQKNVTTHVLRHSFGTNLEVNGADINTISRQMRHKKLETTRIYLHAHEQLKRENYKRFHSPTPI